MLSNIAIKQSTHLPDRGSAKLDNVPETGNEFDFMDYLLGLQAQSSSEDEAAATSVDLLTSKAIDGESEEKEVSQDANFALAALFPGMTARDSSQPEKSEDGNSIIPVTFSSGTDAALGQAEGAKGKAEVDPKANVIDLANGTLPETKIAGLETDRLAGMRAFQSQLAAASVEVPEKDTEKDSSVEGVDLSLSQLQQAFELKQSSQPQTAAAKDTQAATPATNLPELFTRVETLARNGGGTMKVTLNPPELGQVEVEVTTRGKQVQVELKSESGAAKSVLESRLGELKASIQSHDLVVSKLEVNIDHELSRQNASLAMMNNWSGQQQQSSQFSQQSRTLFSEFSGNNRLSGRTIASRAVSNEAPVLAQRTNHGRVDVRI